MRKRLTTRLLAIAALTLAASNAYALCSVGDSVTVLWKGKWYNAQVQDHSPAKCYISYVGYDNSWDEWVGPDRYLLRDKHVNVKWKGKWYGARVLRRSQNAYFIRYDGYDSSWDEWVDNTRIASR